jgi:hypothetical protein
MMFPAMLLRNRRCSRWLQTVGLLMTMLTISLLTGCVVPTEPDPDSPDSSHVEETMPPEMVPERVSDRVLEQASDDLDVPKDELSILRVNQETWSDGCLGLGQPNELCLQALVPGWQLEVVYNDQSDFYRSDDYGDVIRRSMLENNLPPSIADQVIDMASSESGIPANQFMVTSAEPRVWDGCLGIAEPGTVCTQIAIFGWRAVVEGNGETLVYHTDMTGSDIRLNDL